VVAPSILSAIEVLVSSPFGGVFTASLDFSWLDHDAGRHRDFDRIADRGESAIFRIDFENDDVVARHVGAEDVFPIGQDREILRAAPEAGLNFEQRQFPVIAYPVARDAVVSAIGAVEKSPIGRDFEISGVGLLLIVFGQGRDDLPFGERSRF